MLEFCPLCDKNGCKRKIILSQINLKEAVWLCESKECSWPFGYEDFTFVSRTIGETWSSEWETNEPLTVLKSTESLPTSLNELGLDTPPVTPGSGYEIVAHKESVFRETSCSVTSPNISTNNIAITKGNFQLKNNFNKSRHSNNSAECRSIDAESRGHGVSGVGGSSVQSIQMDKRDSKNQEFSNSVNNNLVNQNRLSKLDCVFSLSDDTGFESLDKCLVSSSEEFVDISNAAKAPTESIFDIERTPQKRLLSQTTDDYKSLSDSFVNPKHESTVKCTKWLSDNTKSAVRVDNSYPSNESVKKNSYKFDVSPQISANSPQSNLIESINGTKQLPKIKSIEKANIKLIGAVAVTDQRSSNRYITDSEAVDPLRSGDNALSVINKDDQAKFSDPTEILKKTEESIILSNANNRNEMSNKFSLDNYTVWKNSSSTSKVTNETVVIDGLPPISLSYQIPSFIEEPVLQSTDSRDRDKGRRLKIELSRGSGVKNFSVKNNGEVNNTNNCEEAVSNPPTTNSQAELKRQSMKKPLKRTVHRAAKYQGFNFGSLKKKSKSNASHNEESIKTSLPNLPSPDNISTCSDLTYTSETSCATTATSTSRSDSVGSTIDSGLKSSLGMENFTTISSSDLKSSDSFSPENNYTLESNLNLDTVLDDLLFGVTDALPKNLGDDWLTSLFD